MKKIILIPLLLFSLMTWAQPKKFFVGLENGDLLYANQVRLKNPPFGRPYVLVNDNERFGLEEIVYYQNESGYYTKFKPDGWAHEEFFKRLLYGERVEAYTKTNLYTSVSAMPGVYNGGGTGVMMLTFHKIRHDYYRKDGSSFMKMTYANLKTDLADNAASVQTLKELSNLRKVTGVLYAVGASLLMVSIYDSINQSSTDPNGSSTISPLFATGVVCLAIPVFLHKAKRNKMLEALELYNRYH